MAEQPEEPAVILTVGEAAAITANVLVADVKLGLGLDVSEQIRRDEEIAAKARARQNGGR